MSSLDFEHHKARYEGLIDTVFLTKKCRDYVITAIPRILLHRAKYVEVQNFTSVPWPLVAALHQKESSGRFNCNLHNGQPLGMVTTIVPIGKGPFDTWEESAIDALNMKSKLIKSLDMGMSEWSMPQMLWFGESYNGFGAFKHGINTAYLWCGSNHYTKGGYPSDGKFDPNYVSRNIGIFPIIEAIIWSDLNA